MKAKLFNYLTAATVIAIALTALPAEAAKIRVVTTLTDLADLTRAVGGDLRIDSSLGHGTRVVGTIPLEP